MRKNLRRIIRRRRVSGWNLLLLKDQVIISTADKLLVGHAFHFGIPDSEPDTFFDTVFGDVCLLCDKLVCLDQVLSVGLATDHSFQYVDDNHKSGIGVPEAALIKVLDDLICAYAAAHVLTAPFLRFVI